MGKEIDIGVGGVCKKSKQIYIGVNNVARKVKSIYVGVNGVARLCYSSELPMIVYNSTSVLKVNSDGSTTSANSNLSRVYSVCYNEDLGQYFMTSNSIIYSSSDCINWTTVGNFGNTSYAGKIYYDNGLYIACIDGTGFLKSTDLTTWNRFSPIVTYPEELCYDKNSTRCLTAIRDINYNGSTSIYDLSVNVTSSIKTVTSTHSTSMIFHDGYFFVHTNISGNSYVYKIEASTLNGNTLKRIDNNSRALKLYYHNGVIYGISTTSLYTSTDMFTTYTYHSITGLSQFNSEYNNFVWHNGYFWMVCSNFNTNSTYSHTLMKSSDAITWTVASTLPGTNSDYYHIAIPKNQNGICQ